MFIEKRHNEEPIPDHVAECINVEQLAMLHTIESFGWTLKFIRNAFSPEPMIIVTDPNGKNFGLLEKDGSFNQDTIVPVRL